MADVVAHVLLSEDTLNYPPSENGKYGSTIEQKIIPESHVQGARVKMSYFAPRGS